MIRYVEILYNFDNKVFIDCEFIVMNYEKDCIFLVVVVVVG
jgi:hypothetical protein